MVITDKNFYIVKQYDGTIWNFLYDKNKGIIYKSFKENTCSDYHVLAKRTLNNFSVILLPDDSINILYKDLTETIVLMKYIRKTWIEQEIMKNSENEIFNVDFKAVAYNNKINLIFSIVNKKYNTVTLLHQILDEENNLTNSKMIENIKNDYYVSFNVYSMEDKGLFIMYQRFSEQFQLGYKFFNRTTKDWSNFNLIDTNIYSFSNYSALISNGILNALYIKKEKTIDKLIYIHGKNSTFKKIELFNGISIKLCSFFIIYGEVWCYWIKGTKIYNSFSIDNGNNFSSYPYEQSLNSQYIFKVMYISNEFQKTKNIYVNEIYVTNYDDIKYLIFSNLYSYSKNNEYLSYIEYYLVQVCEKVLSYEKKLSLFENENIEKEEEIFSLKAELSKQENRILSLLEEIKNLQDDINNLNSQRTKANSKSNNWVLKKFFK